MAETKILDIKNIFEPLKDDPNYDEIMKNFRLGSPVKKINLKIEEPNCIVGMYCISSDKINLKNLADMSNLDDDTLLFFTNQHIVELAKILYGMLLLIIENKGTDSSNIYSIISSYINYCKEVNTYYNYKKFCKSIPERYFNLIDSNTKAEIVERFINILNTIIFLPYNELDNLAQAAIKEFKESMENKNE